MQLRAHRRRELGREFREALVRLARIDLDARRLVVREIAQHALREIEILVQQARRRQPLCLRDDRRPGLAQIRDVAGELLGARILGDRAHDVAAFLVRRNHGGQPRTHGLALGLALDLLRDADVRLLRQVDERAARDAHLRRQARALRADRVLDHLHHQRLTFEHDLLDRLVRRARLRLAREPRMPDVSDVQERRALQANVDERRLHAGQHAHDLAEIDVADPPARQRALDVKLLHRALLHECDPRFLRREVDQDFFVHGGIQKATRAARSNAAVSKRGRPMIPEWEPAIRSTNSAARPWIAYAPALPNGSPVST